MRFCMGLCKAIEKWYAKNEKNCNRETQIYANFSYISAPKPVRRIDPSRLERVKEGSIIQGKTVF